MKPSILILAVLMAAALLFLLTATGGRDETLEADPVALPAQARELSENDGKLELSVKSPEDDQPADRSDQSPSQKPDPAVAEFVEGRVSDSAGNPIVGAVVTCYLAGRRDRVLIDQSETDAEGHYRVARHDSSWNIREGDRRSFEILLEARALGFESQTRSSFAPISSAAVQIDFQLADGASVHGRVMANARPVPEAAIYLLSDKLELLKEARSGEDGRFSFDFGTRGTYHVHARHESHGARALKSLDLNPIMDTDLPDNVLIGDGWLIGTVLNSAGKAVPCLLVEAVPEEYALVPGLKEIPFTAVVEAELDGGLFGSSCITDGVGRFDIRGLARGRYGLRFPEYKDTAYQPSGIFETQTRGIELSFYGHRLIVQVSGLRGLRESERAAISCDRIDEEGKGLKLIPLARKPVRQNTVDIPVQPGERYLVRAWAPGYLESSSVVQVEPDLTDTILKLRLFNENAWGGAEIGPSELSIAGRLRVRLRDGEGKRIESFKVRLKNRASNSTPRGFSACEPDEDGWIEGIPPGEYNLGLLAGVDQFPSLTHFDHSEPVTIKPGGSPSLEIEIPPPGNLHLWLTTDSHPADLDSRPGTQVELDEQFYLYGVRAYLRPGGRRSTNIKRLMTFRPLSDRDVTDGERLLPGSEAACEPNLAPGKYSLVLYSKGFERMEYTLQIEAGKITRLEASLKPRPDRTERARGRTHR